MTGDGGRAPEVPSWPALGTLLGYSGSSESIDNEVLIFRSAVGIESLYGKFEAVLLTLEVCTGSPKRYQDLRSRTMSYEVPRRPTNAYECLRRPTKTTVAIDFQTEVKIERGIVSKLDPELSPNVRQNRSRIDLRRQKSSPM